MGANARGCDALFQPISDPNYHVIVNKQLKQLLRLRRTELSRDSCYSHYSILIVDTLIESLRLPKCQSVFQKHRAALNARKVNGYVEVALGIPANFQRRVRPQLQCCDHLRSLHPTVTMNQPLTILLQPPSMMKTIQMLSRSRNGQRRVDRPRH